MPPEATGEAEVRSQNSEVRMTWGLNWRFGDGGPRSAIFARSALVDLAAAAGAVDAGGAGVSAPMSAYAREFAAYSAPLLTRVVVGAFARRVRAHNRHCGSAHERGLIGARRGVAFCL